MARTNRGDHIKSGFFPLKGGESRVGVVEQRQLAEDFGLESCWVNDHPVTEENVEERLWLFGEEAVSVFD